MKIQFLGFLDVEELYEVEGNVKCPTCGKWDEVHASDYVTEPMLWCCNYAILDRRHYKEIQVDRREIEMLLKKGYPGNFSFNYVEEKDRIERERREESEEEINETIKYFDYWNASDEEKLERLVCRFDDCDFPKLYEVDCLFVNRICNFQLCRYKSKGEYDEEKMREFFRKHGRKEEKVVELLRDLSFEKEFKNGVRDLEKIERRLKKLLPKREERLKNFGLELVNVEENDNEDNEGCEDDNKPFRTYFSVNSYDPMEPQISYPKFFDLSHDGIHIYLDCTDRNGDPLRVSFWGD